MKFLLSYFVSIIITVSLSLCGSSAISTHGDEDEVQRDLLFLSQFNARVVALDLVNATSDVKLFTLTYGMVISATNPSFSVNAIVEGKNTRSVALEWTKSDGTTTTHIENTAPFALCSNDKLDFFPCADLGFGTHTLSVKACSKRKGQGRCTTPLIMTFQIQRPVTKAPVAPAAAPITPITPFVPSMPIAPKTPMDVPVASPVSPSQASSNKPSKSPSRKPSNVPSSKPSKVPSSKPSKVPSSKPSSAPSIDCTASAINFLNCNTLTERTLSLTGTTQEDKAAQWVIQSKPLLVPDTEASRLSLLQRYALATMLKDGIGESSGSECDWTGVDCNMNNTVIELNFFLRGTALANVLSKDLGLLSNLVNIDFGFNSEAIRGTIPSELKAWTNMERFYIDRCQLTGTIPSELKVWTNIQTFYVHTNKFTGTIPSELKVWTNIQTFYVHTNKLTGTIPSELAAWTNMQYFFVYKNQLTGIIPTSLGNWTNSQQVYMYCNNFTTPQNISFFCRPIFLPAVYVTGDLTCPCCNFYGDSCS